MICQKEQYEIIVTNLFFFITLKDIEHVYRDVAGYDMSYDDFKELCRKSRDEEYNYLCIDRSKKRDQGRYCICNESKKNINRSNTSDETFLKNNHILILLNVIFN